MNTSLTLKHRVCVSPTPRLPASVAGVAWRRVCHDDIPLLVALSQACHAVDSPWEATSATDYALTFDEPSVNLEQDSVIGLDAQGRAVAYGLVFGSPTHNTLVWVDLEGVVHPERRGEGIGTALLTWQEERGQQFLSTLDASAPALLAVAAWNSVQSSCQLAQENGYRTIRSWLELERELDHALPTPALPEGYRIESYIGNEEAARAVHNDAFRDHWGSQPVSKEEWLRDNQRGPTRTDLSFVIKAPSSNGSDTVVATIICAVPHEDWHARGRRFGYIQVVGVTSHARGMGLATALIAHALHCFKHEALDLAVLSVDAESLTGAVALYERLGFHTVRTALTLVKEY